MEDLNLKYPHLKKKDLVSPTNGWKIENLKDGLNYFFEIHGRYPTVKEVGIFDYLPTSRTIQRSFGGMVSLRKTLGLSGPSDFTTGDSRSNVARDGDLRAQKYEKEFYDYLVSKIPEMRIHEHKIIRPGDTAADFFIYTSDRDGIVVDLFYAVDMHSLGGVVNIKSKKYDEVKYLVYFVLVGNKNLKQEDIDVKIKNRRNQLSKHIVVLTEDNFKEHLIKILDTNKF